MDNKKCERCKKKFKARQWNQIYCGSKSNKTGCSWWNVNENRNKRRWQSENYKEYQRKYGKEWNKRQRNINSDYAVRQRKSKQEYYRSEKGKQEAREWRKKNIEKVLFWNKRRQAQKKNAKGRFSWDEWVELKREHNYMCAVCGIKETDLVKKWKDSRFHKLTIDHIKPIARGGSNYINNIQPLCISCNARKHAK